MPKMTVEEALERGVSKTLLKLVMASGGLYDALMLYAGCCGLDGPALHDHAFFWWAGDVWDARGRRPVLPADIPEITAEWNALNETDDGAATKTRYQAARKASGLAAAERMPLGPVRDQIMTSYQGQAT